MSQTMMKAVRFHEFGGPEVLRYEDAPRPEPQQGEVLVRVHAVGINPPDWYLRNGYKALPPEWRPDVAFPAIPGTDVSGVVEAIGEGVSGFAIGDMVFGMLRFPSFGDSLAYAEYVSAPASDLAVKPANIDHVHAAALPMSGLTAWQFLVDVGHDVPNPLQAEPHLPAPLQGKTVLINGAAGGVGHIALQIAKLEGARIIAVASGKHEALLRGLGADEFIDYTKAAAEDVVRGVNLVVDAVGGPRAAKFLPSIRKGGALFPIFPLGFDAHEEAARLGIRVSATQVRSDGAQMQSLAGLLERGTLRTVIDSQFPLAAASDAHARAERGHIQGKIVLTTDAAGGDAQAEDRRTISMARGPQLAGH